MNLEPTEQQKNIINETRNTVVIAKPGSGKTYVLSCKIKKVLPNLFEYQGVIAISFTNKASEELRSRCLSTGEEKKSSFFGTIDKFFISEIVMPFGKHIFGIPNQTPIVTSIKDLLEEEKNLLSWVNNDFQYSDFDQAHVGILKEVFLKGIIVLETVGLMALLIFDKSLACRNYMKARYSYAIIDEYQDSDQHQHELFIRLQKLGLCAIAVGDADQSIYKFSGKDSRYLLSLTKNPDYVLYPLTLNHRSHPSIVNYSANILSERFIPLEADEIRVFEKFISGDGADIAKWLNDAIPKFMKKYNVTKYNKVGILVRGNRTGKIVDAQLQLSHKLFNNTPLDEDSNIWSIFFCRLLKHLFDIEDTTIDFVEEYLDIDSNGSKIKSIIKLLEDVKKLFIDVESNIEDIIRLFSAIATIVFPSGTNLKSISLIRSILRTSNLLNSYKPARDEEIQIMTIHKSKGLEFDIVFHLDLYEWILPIKMINDVDRSTYFPEEEQDKNLHYVGVTRAKECCILLCSSLRHNYRMEIKRGNYSEFYFLPGLEQRRLTSPI